MHPAPLPPPPRRISGYNGPQAGGAMTSKRADGRRSLDIRKIDVSLGVQKHAEGSVLFAMGDTRVVCAATVADRVPPVLRGAGEGGRAAGGSWGGGSWRAWSSRSTPRRKWTGTW